MEKMLEVVKYCNSIHKKHFNKSLSMTKKDQIDFREAKSFHICKKKFTEKDTSIWYANNLYGWARCQYLPTVGFKWLNEKAI